MSARAPFWSTHAKALPPAAPYASGDSERRAGVDRRRRRERRAQGLAVARERRSDDRRSNLDRRVANRPLKARDWLARLADIEGARPLGLLVDVRV